MQFTHSNALTMGMELEFQIVDIQTGQLSPSSLAFRNALEGHAQAKHFALEATLSTMELNSSVHTDVAALEDEVVALTRTLREIGQPMGLDIRGGGTQLTQFWNERIMAPTPRATELESKYGFLPKRFSTYGMHVHIGVPGKEQAIQLANGLQALVPLFIAISAASPFLQLADTGFSASRPLESLVYPHGGGMPRLRNWQEFEAVTADIFAAGLAASLKDVYWDVRPKPEFGTVEVRVFDTPLSVHKGVAMAAFTRGCAALLLRGTLQLPAEATPATAERVSRFLACRDGMDATLYNPYTRTWMPVRQWLAALVDEIARAPVSATDLGYIQAMQSHCERMQDCDTMRRVRAQTLSDNNPHQDGLHGLAENSRQLCEHLFAPLH
jgi:carboxylate-amine ligase